MIVPYILDNNITNDEFRKLLPHQINRGLPEGIRSFWYNVEYDRVFFSVIEPLNGRECFTYDEFIAVCNEQRLLWLL